MERRQIGLKLVMDGLGLPVEVGDFDDRLILQKAIYLAQAAGVNLGYYYRWYLRGPYCPAVAEDGFCVSAEASTGLDDSKAWQLDAASARRLDAIRPMLTQIPAAQRAKKLELLASVHYLVSRGQVAGREPKAITAVLRKFKKPFNTDEVAAALREMAAHGILS